MPQSARPHHGFTLIEIILFMVIVGVALAALVAVLGDSLRGGADRVAQKQALAIAEAIIEEISLKPSTFCDPDDAAVATATVTGDCGTPEGSGPEAGEGSRSNFDNVNDYASLGTIGSNALPVGDHSGLNTFPAGFWISGLSITNEAFGSPPATGSVPATESLRISITVTAPDGSTIRLDTYRTRYAPNLSN